MPQNLRSRKCSSISLLIVSVIDIRSLTLIPKDKLGAHPGLPDKGKKGKKDSTKAAARDENEEDNEQTELPIVKDHATRGVFIEST